VLLKFLFVILRKSNWYHQLCILLWW